MEKEAKTTLLVILLLITGAALWWWASIEDDLVGNWVDYNGVEIEHLEGGTSNFNGKAIENLTWVIDDGEWIWSQTWEDDNGSHSATSVYSFEIIDDVLYSLAIEYTVDGEDLTHLVEADTCWAYVSVDVADSAEDWKEHVASADKPQWCDAIHHLE